MVKSDNYLQKEVGICGGERIQKKERERGSATMGHHMGRICYSLWSFCKRSSWSPGGNTPGVVSSSSPAPRFLCRRRLLLPSAEGLLPPTRFLLSRSHSLLKRAFSFFSPSNRMCLGHAGTGGLPPPPRRFLRSGLPPCRSPDASPAT